MFKIKRSVNRTEITLIKNYKKLRFTIFTQKQSVNVIYDLIKYNIYE